MRIEARGWRVRLVIAVATLAWTLLAARQAQTRETSGVHLAYDVYYLAFRVLAVESTTVLEGGAYRTNSLMRTVGLLGTLFPWESRSSAYGAVGEGGLAPGGYRLRSTFRGRATEVDLEYTADGLIRDRVSGEYGSGQREPIALAARSGTVDPLTAAVAVSHDLATRGTCDGVHRVFDGVRRYDLTYQDLGEDRVDTGGSFEVAGAARRCRAAVKPLGGFLVSGAGSGESPQTIEAWLAPLAAGEPPVPVRLEIEGSRGVLHAYLQGVKAIEDPPSSPAPVDEK